jgi:nicotinamide riboside kinase
MRIAILGPESSGKSTLAKALANELKIDFTEEYSRVYLNDIGREYHQNDLLEIAKGQIKLWKKYDGESFISDSEMIVLKVWYDMKYKQSHNFLVDAVNKQLFDLYLLCEPDLAWQPDPMRESPKLSDRKELFNLYREELESHKFNFEILSGLGEDRLQNALKIIRRF